VEVVVKKTGLQAVSRPAMKIGWCWRPAVVMPVKNVFALLRRAGPACRAIGRSQGGYRLFAEDSPAAS